MFTVPSRLLALNFALALALFTGCSSSSDSNSTSSSSTSGGTGSLSMQLVDAPPAPFTGLTAVTVSFDSVTVNSSGSATDKDAGWETIVDNTAPEADRTFDLLQLVNGNFAALGLAKLPAGDYTQIRVIVQSATVTISGTTSALTIPSGSQTGIKIVAPFTVTADQTLSLTLDFEVAQSLKLTGNGSYQLSPVIRVVQTDQTGSITGTVTVTTGSVGQVTVSAYDGATLVATTFPNATTGAYTLSSLEAGTYTVTAFDGITSKDVSGVIVTAGAAATANFAF